MKREILSFLLITIVILIVSSLVSAQEKSKAFLLDSFSYSTSEDASARIDNFRNQLNNFSQNGGLIIVYGGQKSKRGEIEAHIRGIKQVFALKRMNENRSPIKNGGFREKLTVEFWIIPQNSDPLKPSPTINKKNVRFKGISKKIIPYDCCF